MRIAATPDRLTRCAPILVLAAGIGCAGRDAPDDDLRALRPPETARIVPVDAAIAGAHVPTLDPAPMDDAEIRKALGPGPHCEFRYTSAGKAVMAFRASDAPTLAVVKLNGHLTQLPPDVTAAREGGLAWMAKPVRLVLAADVPVRPEQPTHSLVQATMTFEVGETLQAGYGGYYGCPGDVRSR